MRNLIYCSDGTGQTAADPASNVYHLIQRLDPAAHHQIHAYAPGLGAGPDGLLGRWFGYGLTREIEKAYRFLIRHYQPGDQVFLFGYSRGAYAMRALTGMLDQVGLLRPEHADRLSMASDLYTRKALPAERNAFAKRYTQPCPIHFIGAWDTVASLGYFYANRRFFNARLTPSVRHARHALAIHERRPRFEPLLWRSTPLHSRQTLKQVWFTGSHGDVGGGYARRGLAEITLQWMLAEAAAQGLALHPDPVIPQPPNPHAPMHKPWQTWRGKLLRFVFAGNRPREIPAGAPMHDSVQVRARYVLRYEKLQHNMGRT